MQSSREKLRIWRGSCENTLQEILMAAHAQPQEVRFVVRFPRLVPPRVEMAKRCALPTSTPKRFSALNSEMFINAD